jgi:hypothetical protein
MSSCEWSLPHPSAPGGRDYSIEEPTPVTEALGRDPATVAHEHADKLTAWLVKRRRFLRASALELPDGFRRPEEAPAGTVAIHKN